MTPLQQTAIDFCREVFGWKEAYLGSDFVLERPRASWLENRGEFEFTDLNAVMSSVAEWSRTAVKPIVCGLDEDGFWAAAVGDASQTRHDSNDMCHALLAACLAAQRKLKGISHD